jgi:hypothetical protein
LSGTGFNAKPCLTLLSLSWACKAATGRVTNATPSSMDLVNLAPRARHFIFLLLDWVEANDAFSALGFHLLDEDKKAFARSHWANLRLTAAMGRAEDVDR